MLRCDVGFALHVTITMKSQAGLSIGTQNNRHNWLCNEYSMLSNEYSMLIRMTVIDFTEALY